jgi:hypothetical protein
MMGSDLREKFEAWAKQRLYMLMFKHVDRYYDVETQRAWEGFQAAYHLGQIDGATKMREAAINRLSTFATDDTVDCEFRINPSSKTDATCSFRDGKECLCYELLAFAESGGCAIRSLDPEAVVKERVDGK